ncbi:cuticle collagen 13-like [Cebus imitator]|uniref:cuticle collagen 13-like n=1 Tax=Cebus imitator TaxID=2715852 RepID=UPI001896F74F|nr:cuticle collagen 13-like [Cebus imitator]
MAAARALGGSLGAPAPHCLSAASGGQAPSRGGAGGPGTRRRAPEPAHPAPSPPHGRERLWPRAHGGANCGPQPSTASPGCPLTYTFLPGTPAFTRPLEVPGVDGGGLLPWPPRAGDARLGHLPAEREEGSRPVPGAEYQRGRDVEEVSPSEDAACVNSCRVSDQTRPAGNSQDLPFLR